MSLKRKTYKKIKKSEDICEQKSQLPITNIGTFNDLANSLATINEVSKGLIMAMPSQKFSDDYRSALELQKSTSEYVYDLGERFTENAILINDVAFNILAPISRTITDIGLATGNATQLFNLGQIDKSAFISAQKLSDLCLDTIKNQQISTLSNLQAIKNLETLNQFVPDSVASLEMITNGLEGVMRYSPVFSSVIDLPSLEIIREKTSITKEELAEHQKKLDNLLKTIDPDLIEIRSGCWRTFNVKGLDYIGQATSSMRRLVDKVLRLIAPDEEVINTTFFKDSPNGQHNGRPTRRARIYCATDYDREQAEHLERLATGLLSASDNLSAWDHEPDKRHDFVQGCFVAIEGYLLSLLSIVIKDK